MYENSETSPWTGGGTRQGAGRVGRVIRARSATASAGAAVLVLSTMLGGGLPRAASAARAAGAASVPPRAPSAGSVRTSAARLPLSFEANRGQAGRGAAFVAHLSGATVFFGETGVVLALPSSPRRAPKAGPTGASRAAAGSTVRLGFAGALPHPRLAGERMLSGRVNYFIGKDPALWHTNVPTYARVVYRGVYPGIDLAFYGRRGHLEYDWIVHPGASPAAIRLSVSGGRGIHLDGAGNLVVSGGGGSLVQNRAVLYQRIRGARRPVAGRYVLEGTNVVGFRVGRYAAAAPLIIDPVIQYSTYVGGSNDDVANGVVADNAGGVYLVGNTSSTNMPSRTNGCTVGAAGCYNAFIAKLDAGTGTITYTTYFGGTYNNNSGNALALDGRGNIFVVGNTQSTDLPRATNNCILFYGMCMQRAYVAKFVAATGLLTYSTYVGGTSTSSGTGIALDGSGNVFIVGTTASSDMPFATNPFHANSATDAYVSELTGSTGAILSSTYVGGSAADNGTGIALGTSGSVYIAGYTTSTDLPAATNTCAACSAGQVGFMAKLNASTWAITFSTYINASSRATAIATDGSGNAFVAGYTFSFTGLPGATNSCTPTAMAPSTCEDAFVTKIDGASGAALLSTYVGGSGGDQGYAIAVDAAGNPYVGGYTESPNLPGATNACAGGSATSCPYSDAFVSKLNGSSGTVLYSMYAGGTDHEDTYGLALDGAGNIYLAGDTNSIDLPNATNLCVVTLGGGCSDAFVVKISTAAPTVTIQAGAGWNMVGGSPLTLWTDSQMNWSFNAATSAWFTPTGTEPAGTGAWEDVPTAGPRTVNVVVCNAAVTVPVTADRWNLVGNPCSRSVALPATARAYWWDPVAQHYILVTSINPGAAAWVKPDSNALTLS